MADLTKGTGHFNLAQGAVATVQGVGAALSATLAGLIIVAAGYSVAFLVLAGLAGLGLILLLLVMPETRDRGVSHSVDRRKAQEPPPVA